MSQASGIFPSRARFFGPNGSAAPSKRQLGIERLEHRCPLDASAAALSGIDVESLLSGIAPPSAPAITSTLHESPSSGTEQRSLPPQPNQTPTHSQAATKGLPAVRRAALAKRPLATDSVQNPTQSSPDPANVSVDPAENAGYESHAPAPAESPSHDLRGNEPRQQAEHSPSLEQPFSGNQEITSDSSDSSGVNLELPRDDKESPSGPDGGEDQTRIADNKDSGRQDKLLPDVVGDEPSDPSGNGEPSLLDDPACPPISLDPVRFVSPPGPPGSIGIVPSGRDASNYWASDNLNGDEEGEPSAITGPAAIRQSRLARSESNQSRPRYYESLTAADEPPVDAWRGRSTPLRNFIRRTEPLDAGIAIGTPSHKATGYAANKHRSPHAGPGEGAERNEAETAARAEQTDLAIAALAEEELQIEPGASEAVQSGLLITTASLAIQESCDSIQACRREVCDEAVIDLSPPQDFMLSLSRWAALGLLISHRLSHQVAGRSGYLGWASAVRDRIFGGRSRNC